MKRPLLGLLIVGLILNFGQSTVCALPWSKEPLDPNRPLMPLPIQRISDAPMPMAVQRLPTSPRQMESQARPALAEVLQHGKWEYKEIVKQGDELGLEELNQLGKASWEMCGARQDSRGQSHFYFKRPLTSWVVRDTPKQQFWEYPYPVKSNPKKAIGAGAGAVQQKQPSVTEGIDDNVPKFNRGKRGGLQQ